MSENVPFVWRKNYRNELALPEKVLEHAHEKARQYLSRAVKVDEVMGNTAMASHTYCRLPAIHRTVGHSQSAGGQVYRPRLKSDATSAMR